MEYVLEEQTWFIWTGSQDLYDVQVKEWIFGTQLDQILVLHKKEIKCMRPQEVGDGMEIVKMKSWELKTNIEVGSVTAGMCIYERFDEHTWATQYYGYWFDRDKIQWVQKICDDIWINIKLHEEKFVRIETSQTPQEQSWIHVLSFLFWLGLMYGTFDIWDWLKHVKIHLPLEWTIAQYEEKILSMIDWIKAGELYVTYSHQDQKNGQLLQVNIRDKEILDTRSSWLWGEKYDLSEYIHKINDFVWHENFTKDNVLKFLHK